MEITTIKTNLPLSRILAHYRLKPDKNNRLNCPWHKDKTPSLQIYPETNSWTCFSSNCDAGSGDQIDFVRRMEKVSLGEAILLCKKMIEVRVQPVSKVKQIDDIQDVCMLFEGLCGRFERSKKAQLYLKNRQVDPNFLRLGYNPLVNGEFKQLRGCVVFPLKNESGQVVSLYGRSILDKEGSKHFYLKNRCGLFPCYPKVETKRLILTESIVDALTLLQYDFISSEHEVLALYGTNGLTVEHQKAIQNLTYLQEIILFFDGDEAGRVATVKVADALEQLVPSVTISKVNTIDNEDVNSILENHEPMVFPHLLKARRIMKNSDKKVVIPQLQITNNELISYDHQPLKIQVLGGIRLEGLDRLRVTLKVQNCRVESGVLRHSLDLYNARQNDGFAKSIAEKFEVGTSESKKILAALTDRLEAYRIDLLKSKKVETPKVRELTETEKKAALSFLKGKNLLENTNDLLAKTGIIGEELNRLLMYIVMSSRKMDKPLHVISLGSSGIGKTYLQEKISDCMPDEDKIVVTIFSENAFYYFEKDALKNKVLIIEDLDGAQTVLYPLRELQTKGFLSKTVTLKDSKGNLKTKKIVVYGPTCIAACTTRESLYEDNSNRCFLIYIDDSLEQDKKVMDYQRKLSAGLIKKEEENKAIRFLQNTQKLLKPIKIINPYAMDLVIPDSVFKPRRTNSHYLQFIEAITFLHQYQRPIKKDVNNNRYIETTISDIKWANLLLKQVLLRKSDELTGACRSFFESLKTLLKQKGKDSFYASTVRKEMRLSSSNLHRHLIKLTKEGYLKIAGGSKYKKGYEYEVVDTEEYERLKGNITTVFDEVIARIDRAK